MVDLNAHLWGSAGNLLMRADYFEDKSAIAV